MKAPVELYIHQPCHENWDAMLPAREGRHCAQCNKVVVDFTQMKDEDVLQYFKQHTGSVCGRLRAEQLSKPDIAPMSSKLKRFLYALACIFLLATSENVKAQQLDSTIDTSTMVKKDSIQKEDLCELKGRVLNEKREPVDFASAVVMQGGIVIGGSKTDLKGNFKIMALKPGVYTLKVSYLGYPSFEQEVHIDVQRKTLEPIVLKKSDHGELQKIILGGVIYRTLVNPSTPGVQKLDKEQIHNLNH